MPVTDPVDASEGSLADFPEFDLVCTVDEASDPELVTIHSADEKEMITHWITVDEPHAMDLEEMR